MLDIVPNVRIYGQLLGPIVNGRKELLKMAEFYAKFH